MNKILTILILCVIPLNSINSQIENGDISYKAYFIKSNQKINSKENTEIKNYKYPLKDKLNKLNASIEEKAKSLEINLLFDKNKSVFFSKNKIFSNKKDEISFKIAKITHKVNTIYFYQKGAKKYFEEIEFSGEKFLVEKENVLSSWNLLNEKEIIGSFSCYKATRIINYKNSKNQLRKKQQTVWYSTDIPVPFGPKNFLGFPGLVLKVLDGSLIYQANAIILNQKSTLKIKSPSVKNVTSEEDFEKMISKLSTEILRGNK